MAIGGVVINFVAKTAQAVGKVDALERALKDVGDQADKADRKMGGLSGSLKAGLAGAAAAVGGGLVAAGAAMVEFGKAALEDKRAADNLASTLKTIPGITDAMVTANEDWISSLQLATNVSDTELRSAVSKLALATGDLGKAQELAALSADVAAGSGKNYAQVAGAMAKAAAGNTSQLERMFPWLDKNKDGTVSLAEATTGLGTAYKDAAKKAADRSPWERLKTIWGEIKESLGQAVIPAVEEFGNWFKNSKNQKAIKDFITQIGDAATEMGEELVPAIRDFLKWVGSDKSQDDMRGFARDLKTIAGATADLVGWLASAFGWLKRVYDWLKKFDDVTTGWIWGNMGRALPATPRAGTTRATGGTSRTIGSMTINLYGDPLANERALKRALEGYDVAMGRAPGQRLARAW